MSSSRPGLHSKTLSPNGKVTTTIIITSKTFKESKEWRKKYMPNAYVCFQLSSKTCSHCHLPAFMSELWNTHEKTAIISLQKEKTKLVMLLLKPSSGSWRCPTLILLLSLPYGYLVTQNVTQLHKHRAGKCVVSVLGTSFICIGSSKQDPVGNFRMSSVPGKM